MKQLLVVSPALLFCASPAHPQQPTNPPAAQAGQDTASAELMNLHKGLDRRHECKGPREVGSPCGTGIRVLSLGWCPFILSVTLISSFDGLLGVECPSPRLGISANYGRAESTTNE